MPDRLDALDLQHLDLDLPAQSVVHLWAKKIGL
jgi:hypothetical protein